MTRHIHETHSSCSLCDVTHLTSGIVQGVRGKSGDQHSRYRSPSRILLLHPGTNLRTVRIWLRSCDGSAGAHSPGKTSSEVAFTIKGRRVRAWLTSVGLNLIPTSASWWTPWACWYQPPDCIPFEEILSACARNRPSKLPCRALHQACTHALSSTVRVLLSLLDIRGDTECPELM